MPVQTTYAQNPDKGFKGMIATADGAARVVPARQAEVSAVVPVGRAVAYYTVNSDDGARLPSAINQKVKGIVAHDHHAATGRPETALDDNGDVRVGNMMNVVVSGEVWVICADGCSPGAGLHVRAVAGALGECRATADGINTIDCSASGTWLTTAAPGALARLRVDFA